MDLRSYQRQMCLTLKKYLNLISLKRDHFHEKAVEKEYLDLLREIISIHESQKSVISALRGVKNSSGGHGSSLSSDSPSSRGQSERLSLGSSEKNGDNYNKVAAEKDVEPFNEMSPLEFTPEKALARHSSPFKSDAQLSLLNSKETTDVTADDAVASLPYAEDAAPLSPWPTEDKNQEDDIHDLVTAYEFMRSLGLLTIQECDEVLQKRQERHKKTALSHVFCQAIWEKQETKRKKRDWLLSSSPPQLRRKIRPGSHPPSRQPSRPSSPAEAGSSSPTSSLSPPPPVSPGVYNQNSQTSHEICPLCKEKGASFQCDGCGVLYHSSCVDSPDDDYLSEWLCSKCEKLGLRTSTYLDPLHQKSAKEDLSKREPPLTCKTEPTPTNQGQPHKMVKDPKEQNPRKIKKFSSFFESETSLIAQPLP